MNKVNIQGDVGQIFTGDVQHVHIHHLPPAPPPSMRGWSLVLLVVLLVFSATGWLLAIGARVV